MVGFTSFERVTFECVSLVLNSASNHLAIKINLTKAPVSYYS